jgi:hypothetical protein
MVSDFELQHTRHLQRPESGCRFGLAFLVGELAQIFRPDFDLNPQCPSVRMLGRCGEYGTRTNHDFTAAATVTLEQPE